MPLPDANEHILNRSKQDR